MAGAVVHFEIQVADVARAVNFYTAAFGWEASMWPGSDNYWLVKTGRNTDREGHKVGIDGAIYGRYGEARPAGPSNAAVLTIDVDDVDAMVVKVRQFGGSLAIPKRGIPDVGWLAYCRDPDGNLFGMMQSDPNAKE